LSKKKKKKKNTVFFRRQTEFLEKQSFIEKNFVFYRQTEFVEEKEEKEEQIIQRQKSIPSTTIFVLITGLCQVGGTNRNAGGRVTNFYDQFTLNGAEFASACDQVRDLSRQMKLDHPNLSLKEAIWCSNFQSQNPNCPETVQNWLKENYNKRFTN